MKVYPEKSCINCGEAHTKRGVTCSSECAAQKRQESAAKVVLTCQLCSSEFKTKTGKGKYCSADHYKSCEACGRTFVIPRGKEGQANPTCGASCGAKYSHRNPESKELRRKNSRERWGVDNPFQANEVKAKISRFFDENPERDTRIGSERMSSLIKEKYGVENISQADSIKKQKEATFLAVFGFTNPMKSEEVKLKLAKALETPYGDKRLENFTRVSKVNQKLAKKLNTRFGLEGKILFEKFVGDHSYDLYIEEKNLLIELNPTISHNATRAFVCFKNKCESPCEDHSPVSPDYHYRRALTAQQHGYRLIQIYGWDSQEKVLSLIGGKVKELQKLSARKTELKKISQKEANIFLEKHHFQGGSRGQKWCYGLHHEDRLLAVATFSKARFKAKAEYEFMRYAVHEDYLIHGAANKLHRAFLDEADPETVISYVDFDHTTTNTFLPSLGFRERKPTGPQLIWTHMAKGGRIYHNSLLAQGADRLLGTSYGKPEVCGLNNEQIMLLEGWVKVYTSGNRVFWWEKHREDLP